MEINVPVKNQDGSLSFTATLSEPQVQAVLQFGLNMAMGMGIASQLINLPEQTIDGPTSVQ